MDSAQNRKICICDARTQTGFGIANTYSPVLCNSSAAGRAFTANPLEVVEQLCNGFAIEVCVTEGSVGIPRGALSQFERQT